MKKCFLCLAVCLLFTSNFISCAGGPPPPPPPGVGKPIFKEDDGIKQILGSEYDAFKKKLTEKDIRIKTWNTLVTDPDKKSSDFAQTFKSDKEKFNDFLKVIDGTKTSQEGVGKIKLMLQGKPTSQPLKPIKPTQAGGVNHMALVMTLKDSIDKIATNTSALLPANLLKQPNEKEFKQFFQDHTSKDATEEMLEVFRAFKKSANQPLGQNKPSSTGSLDTFASALSNIKA